MKKYFCCLILFCFVVTSMCYGVKKTYQNVDYWIGPGQENSFIEEQIKKAIDKERAEGAKAAMDAEQERTKSSLAAETEASQRALSQANAENERAKQAQSNAQSALSDAQNACEQALQSGVSKDSPEYKELEKKMLAAKDKADAANAYANTCSSALDDAKKSAEESLNRQKAYEEQLEAERKELEWIQHEEAFIVANAELLVSNMSEEKKFSILSSLYDPFERQKVIEAIKSEPTYARYKRAAKAGVSLFMVRPPEEVGDPVLLSTGQYALETVETSIHYGLYSFPVRLYYVSGGSGDGSFGKKWMSSLDTCIVRSEGVDGLGEYIELLKNINTINSLKNRVDKISILSTEALQQYNRLETTSFYLQNLASNSELSMQKHQSEVNRNSYVNSSFISNTNAFGYNVIFYMSDNSSVGIYAHNNVSGNWEYINEGGVISSFITEKSDGSYELHELDGKVKYFNRFGQPVKFEDEYGSSIEFDYDEETHRLDSITHKGRKLLTLAWNSQGCIDSIYNHCEKKHINFVYENNLLSFIENENAKTSFVYDSDDDLIKIVKDDGSSVDICYGSDSDVKEKRVMHVKNEESGTETFSYDYKTNSINYVDADGFETSYVLNEFKQVSETHFSDGTYLLYDYDDYGRVIATTDMFGTKKFSYDEYGNMKECLYPDGSFEVWSYLKNGNLNSYTDRDGVVTNYEYDIHGGSSGVVRNGVKTLTIERNSWGGISRIKGHGLDCECLYDENYNQTSDGSNSILYSDNNTLKEVKDLQGNVKSYSYDEKNYSVTATDSNGNRTIIVRNARGDITEVYTENPQTGYVHVDEYSYDKRHLLLSYSEGDGETCEAAKESVRTVSECTYTLGGRLARKIIWNEGPAAEYDACGVCYTYEYDCHGNIIQTEIVFIDSAKSPIGNPVNKKFDYSYRDGFLHLDVYVNGVFAGHQIINENNQVLSVTDPENRRISFEYTPAGNLKAVKNIYGGVENYIYDSATGEIANVLRNGIVMNSFVYDDMGNLIKQISADGFVTDYKKNIFSSSSIDECSQNEGVSYSVLTDSLGRTKTVFKVVDGIRSLYCSYSYNAFGSISQEVFSNGIIRNYHYDVLGNLLCCEQNGTVIWEGTYTERGQLASEKGLLMPFREYTYDGSGNLLQIVENGTIIQKFTYSPDMRTVACSDAKGMKYVFFYDEFGNCVSRVDRLGHEESFSTDVKNGISFTTDKKGASYQSHLDKASNIISVLYDSGRSDILCTDSQSFITGGSVVSDLYSSRLFASYDSMHNMKEVYSDYDVVKYETDCFGNTVMRSVDDMEISYEYNTENLVTGISVGNNVHKIRYDERGLPVFAEDENGVITKWQYDDLLRPVYEEARSAQGELLFSYGLTYDGNGHIVMEMSYNNGTFSVSKYSYDRHFRLTGVIRNVSESLELQCLEELSQYGFAKEADPLLPDFYLSENEATQFRQFGGKTYKAWEELYSYDENGNRITKTTPYGIIAYSYDEENRLIESSFDGGKSSIYYCYDANGNLIEKKSVYKTETFTYTEDNRVKEFICLDSRSKTQACVSFAYDVFGRLIQKVNSDGSITHFAYDGFSFRKLKEWTDYSSLADSMVGSQYRYRHTADSLENTSTRYFVYADNRLVYQIVDGKTFSCIEDWKSSLRTCIDSEGQVSSSVDYTVDGLPLIENAQTGDLGLDCSYCGKFYDKDMRLYDFGYRFYSPDVARFTTEDPVRDSENWYSYCRGNPIDYSDDLGLEVRITVDMNNMTLEAQYIFGGYVVAAISTDNGVRDPWKSPITTAVKSGDTRAKSDTARAQYYGEGFYTVPTKFPEGIWDIWLDTNRSGVASYGTDWIRSNATQSEQYARGEKGKLNGYETTVAAELYDDYYEYGSGYCIHMTGTSNTNGCVGVHEQYIMDSLVEMMRQNAAMGESEATLIITYGKPYDSTSIAYYADKGGVVQPSKTK